MSIPKAPKPAKLVIGLFMSEKALLTPVSEELVKKFGPADIVSPWLPFDYTTYYEPEMGSKLFRRVFSFNNLINQESLSEIKVLTNKLESEFLKNNKRRINIDPGYLLHERFVLATGKNFAHRIYIGMNIYADLTLIYQKGAFQKLPWTYPDYADTRMLSFLEKVRKKYTSDLKP
ncbi:MAG: DUF4416 family protein [Desulfobacteraceae bacterium]|nr:DUF4416 family protein [Desulfobacteraceae bacterium]